MQFQQTPATYPGVLQKYKYEGILPSSLGGSVGIFLEFVKKICIDLTEAMKGSVKHF